MQLDKTLISRLEKLAKLKMTEAEEADLLKDLNKIMEMIDHIQEVDVSGVEPLRHMADRHDVTRPDVVEKPLDQEIALKNGPDTKTPFFRVPNVLAGSKKKMNS
jgi:aspartyl-tRNA(Asn)/glutamyl-tRNA(Gln) amidotransferase subunit C